jgi:hypothetical protein
MMNEELQSKLVEVLTGISEGVAQAKDFAVEQLPDVAQQYIMFGMVWETTAFAMLIAATGLCCWVFVRGWKLALDKKSSYGEADRGQLMMLFSSMTGIVFAIFAVVQLRSTLLVWLAPKLYLLQGIAGLVK